jgi:hypothetical protein
MKKTFYTTSTTFTRGLILGLFSLLFVGFAQAQTATDGDYRSAKATGNWSDVDMWETRTAGTWAVTATAPAASNNVYIQDGHVVTVDVATANCKDLQLTASGTSSLVVGTNVLRVSGKMRAYSGTTTTGAVDGSFYTQTSLTTGFTSTAATTTAPGTLQIVGASRTVFNTSEWGGSGFVNCELVFNLTSGQTATADASFKFRSITVSNGSTLNAASTARIGVDDGAGTGALTIKTGGKIISARSATTSQVISATSTTKCGTVTIENGGILELTGSTPAIDCTTFTNNGTVTYSRAGTQTLLQKGADATATAISSYSTLVLSNTSTKTPFNAITVSNTLQFTGAATFAPTASLTLTMLNGSTVDRGATSGTSLPSTPSAVFYGTMASDLVNVTISSSLSNSNELPSAPTPGKVGTLTVNSGVTYTITGGRTITDLVNNNIVALVPGTVMTLVINGNISGSGTITGHANASITIGGTTGGNAGTLNFTSGGQIANNMTINRTGTTPSVTLGTPLTLNATTGNLTLTSGQIILGANTLTTAIITGGSSSAYVVTNGSGALKRVNFTGSTVFPVGTSTDYTPATVVNNATARDFSVKVGTTFATAPAVPTKAVQLQWDITPSNLSGNDANLSLQWPSSANGTGTAFTTASTVEIAHHNGSIWDAFKVATVTGTGTSVDPYVASATGFSAFSPFIVANQNALAVELSNFQAKSTQKTALLTWTTATEKDNAYFNIEHSTNGTAFETIGQVKGNGTTTAATTYNFEHQTPSVSVNYYRLKQVDVNGTSTYSAVRSVVFGKSSLVVKVTLVMETLDIVVSDTEKDPLSIFNLSGQNVMNVKAQGAQRVNVSALPAGMYIIRVGTTGEAVRFVKQ